ncbi:MAG: hypothetical protein SAL07_17255 [Oscillatoria sp. PMC 1051.18]|uniref:Asr1405/Asl0597 family protein n=1 Tax=Oscillatoria salina TaxID=331517 RepID=UPI0013B813BF|nr:Asr1405/Asl0597 family protein [Oscillatoria salina]MBZ8181743.1 hypothetical protein [Oscillatoria salina IIICB1]MEC4892379.1 hypothetical protein [Oscillatoria sp. PMC 1050.18]MEC5031650.1 hypothetical protein [Oscillatoria sp. PMC 1051.18]NET89892.1 hypothetical protein [Kamptonema sp. SIO1D9]
MSSNPKLETGVAVNWADRWQVYYRLQDLQIPCRCATNQELQVEVYSPTGAIQLWSVVRNLTASRRDLINWLNCCWQLETSREES